MGLADRDYMRESHRRASSKGLKKPYFSRAARIWLIVLVLVAASLVFYRDIVELVSG